MTGKKTKKHGRKASNKSKASKVKTMINFFSSIKKKAKKKKYYSKKKKRA